MPVKVLLGKSAIGNQGEKERLKNDFNCLDYVAEKLLSSVIFDMTKESVRKWFKNLYNILHCITEIYLVQPV